MFSVHACYCVCMYVVSSLLLLCLYLSVHACGGELTGSSGSVTSPGFPNPYPARLVCIWTITVPETETLTFNLTTVDMETHRDCRYDYLEVMAGIFTILCFVDLLLSIQTVFFLLFLFVLHPQLAYIFMTNISLYSMFAYSCLSTIDLMCLSRGIPIVILILLICPL